MHSVIPSDVTKNLTQTPAECNFEWIFVNQEFSGPLDQKVLVSKYVIFLTYMTLLPSSDQKHIFKEIYNRFIWSLDAWICKYLWPLKDLAKNTFWLPGSICQNRLSLKLCTCIVLEMRKHNLKDGRKFLDKLIMSYI